MCYSSIICFSTVNHVLVDTMVAKNEKLKERFCNLSLDTVCHDFYIISYKMP